MHLETMVSFACQMQVYGIFKSDFIFNTQLASAASLVT